MIPAIVLAAGASARMGRPKGMLDADGRTFIQRILDTLGRGGAADAVVVVREGDRAMADAVTASGFGRVVVNPRADEGQLSSLVAGLDAIDRPGVEAALVTLVDVPLVAAESVRRLLARAAESPAPILRAVYQGAHGHPVIFKRVLFDALRHADPSIGAKEVVRSAGVEDVEVGDPGVLVDVDTPAEYARLFGRPPAGVNPEVPNS
jgi:molybdenum cofactor cytidylyltransferase